MSLIRAFSKLTSAHQTIPVRSEGFQRVEVRLELESITGTLAVKLRGCWQRGPWDDSSDVWVGGSAISGVGVHVEAVDVPDGVDALCLYLEPSQECVVRSCDMRAVR